MYYSKGSLSQRDRLAELLETQPIVRAYEMRKGGITPSMISSAVMDGDLFRIARGLYQRADGEVSAGQSLAEASKLVPKGVIALTSALAFASTASAALSPSISGISANPTRLTDPRGKSGVHSFMGAKFTSYNQNNNARQRDLTIAK